MPVTQPFKYRITSFHAFPNYPSLVDIEFLPKPDRTQLLGCLLEPSPGMSVTSLNCIAQQDEQGRTPRVVTWLIPPAVSTI